MDKRVPKDRVREQAEPYSAPEDGYPGPDDEFLGMEEERYEIVEGVRYEMHPAPSVPHQRISGAIYLMLSQTCHPNGIILYAPVDVYLDKDNLFEPDLVFVLHENASIIKEKRIEGAPDLVVEILSPTSGHRDKIRKKRQYERHGVKEYWIVDPVHRTVDQFVLEQGAYRLHETYGTDGELTSPLFSCVRIDMSRLFPQPL
jgi:Uma2 family endonuclease